jgi:hypothetical protein
MLSEHDPIPNSGRERCTTGDRIVVTWNPPPDSIVMKPCAGHCLARSAASIIQRDVDEKETLRSTMV